MTTTELVACPFGHKHRDGFLLVVAVGDYLCRVKCQICLAEGPIVETPAAAIAAWNRRVSTPEIPDVPDALRLGKAVIHALIGIKRVDFLRRVMAVLRGDDDIGLFKNVLDAIADNYPGKPESSEEQA